MVKFYIKAGQKYIDTHEGKLSKCQDTAEWFYRDVFCTSNESWILSKGGFFGKPDFKKFLENYFDVKL